jgi:hypothetical protein
MLQDIILKGSTDRSVTLRCLDSTTGAPKTDVVYNSAGIDLWYRRELSAVVSITEATLAALTTAHADGGFLHIGNGYYRLDLPDAAFATGANYVEFGGTVTGGHFIGGKVKLVNVNMEDAVRMGLTALPNANAEAAGGLYTRGTGAGQINQSNNGQIDANAARTGGTTNTGRDIGASVLLSSGTGTGQISLSSGAVLLQATQTGVTIPTVTTLTNAPSDSSGVTTLLSRLSSARAGYLDNLSAGAVALASSLTSAAGDITTILGKFTGITSLAQWLGLIAGKQTGNSTARTELRATGAGSGTFDETNDSLEALRDRGDAAWTTAAGFATAANLATLDGKVDTGNATLAKLDDTLEDDGGTYRFTTNALEQAPSGGGGLTVQDIVDGVWDEPITDHLDSGSTGAALNAAGSAGDPWSTPLPGAYGSGTAGKIVGDNLNATVGSRASQSSVDDLPTNAELATALDPLPTAAENATAVWAAGTRVLTAGTNIALAKGTGVTGFNDLDAAGVRSAVGLGSANLDTQLSDLPTAAENATAVWGAGARTLTAIDEDSTTLDLDATIRGAVGMSSANLDTQLGDLPTAAENAAAVIGATVEGSVTVVQSLRLANSALAGKASGLETTNPKFRDLGDTKDRIDATTDADGNRSAVTLDLT